MRSALLFLRVVVQAIGTSQRVGARGLVWGGITSMVFVPTALAYRDLATEVRPELRAEVRADIRQELRYPQGQNTSTSRVNYSYSIEMLKLAIEKSKAPFRIVEIPNNMPQLRKIEELREGKNYDVYWSATNLQLEKDFIPVRICLMKGLNGWRIPVVTRANQHLFDNVNDLVGLRKLSAGSAFSWADTQVLQAAGITTELSYDAANLYRMLAVERFDYLPRGVQELWPELTGMNETKEVDFVPDMNIVIRYHNPRYFFVNRNKPEFAEAIRQGLEIAIKDGSFDELFYRYFGDAIRKAQLEKRRIITIKNPQLSPETPLERKELWFTLDDLKRKPKH